MNAQTAKLFRRYAKSMRLSKRQYNKMKSEYQKEPAHVREAICCAMQIHLGERE